MPGDAALNPFTFSPSDPLAAEHEAVLRWIAEATASPNGKFHWREVDLKTLESGRILLAAKPEQARKFILAALAQAVYWEQGTKRIRESAQGPLERANIMRSPAYKQLAVPRHHALEVVAALIRRAIPFQRDDLAALLRWCLQGSLFNGVPAGFVVRSLERYGAANPLDEELTTLTKEYADKLRNSHESRRSTVLDQLIAKAPGEEPASAETNPLRPAPQPAAAGNPLVMRQLKSILGLARANEQTATTAMGPDRFQMPAASPLREAHERLNQFAAEVVASEKHRTKLREFPSGQAIFNLEPARLTQVLLAAAERHIAFLFSPSPDFTDVPHWKSRWAVSGLVPELSASPLDFDRELLFDFILYLSVRPQWGRSAKAPDAVLFEAIERFGRGGASLSEGERYVLHLWRRVRITGPPMGAYTPDLAQLTAWIGDGAQFFLVPGEWWSEAVNADLEALSPADRKPWLELLKHALSATTARPSDRWRKQGRDLIARCGKQRVRKALERWLPLVAKGRTVVGAPEFVGDTRSGADSIHEENANALRGFLWLVPLLPRQVEFIRLAASVALTAYRKVPGVGPRAVKVGNAAVYCLSQMVSPEAMGQLAMLKVRVRFGTAQKEVEKAFDAAAAELKLPRDQVEEMSVPACGLETVGLCEEQFGKYRAQLIVTGSDAELRWFDEHGKQLKSVPAAVKAENAEDVKELQTHLRDVQAMLAAQRERMDALFLERKTWPLQAWRERYIDHPLVGTIARRLIWVAQGAAVTMLEGVAADVNGNAMDFPQDAVVQLWHPAGRGIDEIVAWRRRIESLGVVQPFKQAHREIYLLTDAELRTARYSNRFAGHILRQHQFNALCGARRWKNKLRLMVDDTYPPASRDLPAWNLRAEFWIEGVGDQFGQDTNDSGVFLRLATDQVRFYRINAAGNRAHAGGGGYTSEAGGPGDGDVNEPLTLEQIPELVFSEVMRDVDLFVGVASVGNDPTWQDGGPEGRYITYWQSYSFGELSATAVSRRETLERLLPRLKIRDQCVLADRFLQVRGTRRTYKIHLGSGNILMEPNDQYLCIVPDAHARLSGTPIYLPFEGDATLSIILSKAFLLADDGAIKDDLINRQIDRR